MGAPDSGMQAAEQSTAESLLSAFRTIKPQERQKHATVLDYWLSIRGDKEFPPLHDLDPLEISDAGPNSILLELIGGGQDAEIRHLGEALASDVTVSRIIDAPNPSLLSSIARKLPIVSISREFLAFEDSFTASAGLTRCWVTLLPLSSCGSWVDYVYALVSLETAGAKAAAPAGPVVEIEQEAGTVAEGAELAADAAEVEAESVEDTAPVVEQPVETLELDDRVEAAEALPEAAREEPFEAPAAKGAPGFSKLLDGIANLAGFYGQGVNVDSAVPTMELTDAEPVDVDPPAEPSLEELAVEADAGEPVEADEEIRLVEPDGSAPEIGPAVTDESDDKLPDEVPEEGSASEIEPAATGETNDGQPGEVPEECSAPNVEPRTAPVLEGPLQDQLAQVRAKAEEARQAQLRVTQALHESLSAAYDFALDAEGSPEEYLRLVEAQGVRIQLRAPMAPVARMAFDDVCDAATIRQFEAVLAWALKVELPRGALLERIEAAGGVPELLSEFSKAA